MTREIPQEGSHNEIADTGRRTLLKAAGAGAVAFGTTSLVAASASAQTTTTETDETMTTEWDKTFPKSDKVDHEKVTFTNRYGITLVGDLYMPKERAAGKLPAIAVAGPFGAVKEQAAGLYAQTMAERGFVTVAFDPSYVGESGGEPRSVASPDINTEDFMAAIDYLGLNDNVDRERIGIIGICGFGGMALNAVAADKRVKAVATTSMYDMSRVMAKGYYDALTDEQRAEGLRQMSYQRWDDAESGEPALAGGLPDSLDGIDDPVIRMYYGYYKTDRGYHPRSVNSNAGWTVTNPLSFMNMPLLTYVDEISPRPMLVIAGSEAHSRYFTEDAYKAAAEPKEMMIIDGADHVDLYDQTDIIPFDKLQGFFEQHLA
ncbi:alpha/beta hydrolase [uncultured Martelella sp.]|uniref:alpha/beta hydrolase n=1 Tax=uncultured Martelella sp. TaxID=392331 RepID=UPI0029C91870|nr:alpha/beta hydrolase [uncultured Martelella sp.]